MNLFLACIDRSSRWLEGMAVLLLFAYCGLMLAEVVARGFIGKSLPYSWEYSAFAMAAIFLLASGSAIRTAVHVRVSLLLEVLPEKYSRVFDILANVIALVVVGFIVVAIYNAFSTSLDRGLVSPSIVKTPLAIPQALLLLGAVQLWFDLLARGIRLATGRVHEQRQLDAAPA